MNKPTNTPRFHEDFAREDDDVKASERSLGIVFACVCSLIGLIKLYHHHDAAIIWLVAAGVFITLAYFWTAPLRPLNLVWHRFGLLLFAITNPIVMGVMFFSAILPTGLIMHALGKDLLRLKKDSAATTYWIQRDPAGPASQDMKNQF